MPQGLQHPEHPGFVSPTKAYDCAACIRWHGEKFGYVDLDPENADAWGFYQRLQTQVRIGMDIVGLDYGVLPVAFDLYRVPEDERLPLFEKLLVIDAEAGAQRSREHEREKRRRDMEAAAEKGRTLGR